jgi:hypothetical protein
MLAKQDKNKNIRSISHNYISLNWIFHEFTYFVIRLAKPDYNYICPWQSALGSLFIFKQNNKMKILVTFTAGEASLKDPEMALIASIFIDCNNIEYDFYRIFYILYDIYNLRNNKIFIIKDINDNELLQENMFQDKIDRQSQRVNNNVIIMGLNDFLNEMYLCKTNDNVNNLFYNIINKNNKNETNKCSIKPLFIFENISWGNILLLLKFKGINISGGSLSYRDKISTNQLDLLIYLLSIYGFNLLDIKFNIINNYTSAFSKPLLDYKLIRSNY